jgi:serine/threonine protein phosphatase 1
MAERDRFAAGIEAQHRRLDASVYEDVYVVGDVHGCRGAVERLLSRLAPGPDDVVVFVGDIVRRGPDSPGVVDLVRSHPNTTSIRGNNEEKIIAGRRPPEGLDGDDIRWLRSLPAVLSWDNNLVVHGGLDPGRARTDHSLAEIQTMESVAPTGDGRPYWWERYDGPERVFFGHKVLSQPFVGDWAVGLDTGCVYGGELTAYDCSRDRTISVEAEQAHKERAARKFLDPMTASA